MRFLKNKIAKAKGSPLPQPTSPVSTGTAKALKNDEWDLI